MALLQLCDLQNPDHGSKVRSGTICIGGSIGGVPGACPPRVQILSFRHTKFLYWKILDPPRISLLRCRAAVDLASGWLSTTFVKFLNCNLIIGCKR